MMIDRYDISFLLSFVDMSDHIREKNPLGRDDLLLCMKSDDWDFLGVLHEVIFNKNIMKYVNPPLSVGEVNRFLIRYLGGCIVRDQSSSIWAHSGYEASWEMANWFNYLLDGGDALSSLVGDARDGLESLYLNGDNKTRSIIIKGCLEHVFEHGEKGMALFSAWQHTPLLEEAYEEAAEYVRQKMRHGL